MTRQRESDRLAAIVFGFALLSGAASLASTGPALAGEEEGATYARVRHLRDDMTIARAAEGEIFAATLNAPILPGDRAWTEGHRAEIELADSSLIWVDEWTRVGFRSLTDVTMAYADHNLIVLEEGSIRIDTYDPEDEGQAFQIDTEAGTIYLLSGGQFRVDAAAGVTTLSSISGVAELSGDGGSILVRSGERSSVRTGRTPSEPRHFNTARLDEFDRYSQERSMAYLRGRDEEIPEGVREEVPIEVHHYIHELSIYGRWYSVPSYGWVWRPAYHDAWGPYYDGYWTWCASGWSWVSYEPWGWAPYHYGRWDHVASIGWVWIPGRSWSGAWVSFAVGPTYVGWAPLNYYNRPVFHDARFAARGTVRGADLQTKGWRFARHEQFARPDRARVQARGERMPQDSEAVITRNLPRFDRTATAKRQEPGLRLIDSVQASRTPLPVATDDSGREIPFRKLERPPAGKPRAPQRGVARPLDRSAGEPSGSRGTVPAQPRGRPGAAPPPGRSDPAGSSDDGRRLRSAPRDPGLNLEEQGDVAAPEGRATVPEPRQKPGAAGQASGQEEKRRRHAVEQLFRGSRQRPAPRSLEEDSKPEKPRAKPPATRGRSTRSQESGDRGKSAGGRGETADTRDREREKGSARSPSGRGESGSRKDSGRQDGAAKKSPDRDRGKSGNASSRRSEGNDGSSGRRQGRDRGR